jgi:hypothetical protein
LDVVASATEIVVGSGMAALLRILKPWKSIQDMRSILYAKFPEPQVANTWKRDDEFGYQSVAGVHPVIIASQREVPDWVSEETIQKATGEKDVKKLFGEGYFYTMDYRERLGSFVKDSTPGRYLTAPVALLYHRNKSTLVPVCIQLAKNQKVYTPEDKGWFVVKAWVANADTQVHQVEVKCFFNLNQRHIHSC